MSENATSDTKSAVTPLDHNLVLRIVASPHYDEDHTLYALTPAGAQISHDAGEHWHWFAREVIPPFPADLAVGVDAAGTVTLVVSTPAGLLLSPDCGDTWAMVPQLAGQYLLVFTTDNALLAIDDDGDVWRGDLAAGEFQRAGKLPGPPLQVVSFTDAILALTEAGLCQSTEGGRHWQCLEANPHDPVVAIASPLGGLPVRLHANGKLLRGAEDAAETIPFLVIASPEPLIATDHTGSFIAISDDASLYCSANGGQEWQTSSFPTAAISLAITPDGVTLLAGLDDGRFLISPDFGLTWHSPDMQNAAVITHLTTKNGRIIATSIDGACYSLNKGTWQPEPLPDPAILLDRSSDDGNDRIQLRKDGLFLQEHISSALLPVPLPEIDPGAITDLAIGHDSSGVLALAAAVRTGEGECAVWLRIGDGDWRRVIAHPELAQTISLTMPGGARQLFASIGDSVYRPAKVGAMLFGREVISSEPGFETLHLTGARQPDGEITLAVLTSLGVHTSTDGGFTWTPLPSPPEAPVTALTIQPSFNGPKLHLANLGGAVHTITLPLP